MSAIKMRGHVVAQKAYDCVTAQLTFDKKKEYGSLAHKLPVLILQNGLAQATGFLLAKNTVAHLALLDDLARVLGRQSTGVQSAGKILHAEIIQADVTQTMLLTRRSLEAAGWIKRYVQGVLKIDSTGDAESEEQAV